MKKFGLLFCLLMLVNSALFGVSVEIGNGTDITGVVPTYGYSSYSWSHFILPGDAIASAIDITKLEFNVSNTPVNYVMNNQIVYLKATSASTVTTDYTANPSNTGYTEVFNGTVTWNGGGWQGIELTAPFAYDGTSNIEIIWENRAGTYANGQPDFYRTDTPSASANKYSYSSFPAGVGTIAGYYPNTRVTWQLEGEPGIPTLVVPEHNAINTALDVVLEWATGENTDYTVLYLADNENLANAIVVNPATSPYLTSLNYGTTYYWQIKAVGATNIETLSNISSFTTNFDIVREFPWTEGFEGPWVGIPAAPASWSQVAVYGTNLWESNYLVPHTGLKCAKGSLTSTIGTHLLITPTFDFDASTNYRLKFWLKGSRFVGTDLKVEITSDYPAATGFAEELGYFIGGTNMPPSWTEQSIPLIGYSGNQTIIFRAMDADGYAFYIDDVIIEEMPEGSVIQISPESQDFGSYSQYAFVSAPTSFTISNSGSADATINEIVVVNPAFFTVTDDNIYPLILESGGSITVSVMPLTQLIGINNSILRVNVGDSNTPVATMNYDADLTVNILDSSGDDHLNPLILTYAPQIIEENTTTPFTAAYSFCSGPSIVYKLSLTTPQIMDISLEGTLWDTKLWVFNSFEQINTATQNSDAWYYNDDESSAGNAGRSGEENKGRDRAVWSKMNPSFALAGDYYIIVSGYSANSGDFTMTINNADIPAPAAAVNPFPANNAVDLSSAFILTWNNAPYTETLDLWFGIAGNGNMTKILDNVTAVESHFVAQLSTNTTYNWKVINRNSTGETLAASVITWSFTTTASVPGVATYIAPANNAINVAKTGNLTWEATTGADGYLVYLSETYSFIGVSPVYVATNTYAYSVDFDMAYYWKVIPYNGLGQPTEGISVWSFTTVSSPFPGNGLVFDGERTVNHGMPMEPYYGYTMTQNIYQQAELNLENPAITSISYLYNKNSAWSETVEIYLAHTTKSTFSSVTDWEVDNFTRVFSGTMAVNTTDEVVTFTFDTPFFYNNTNNLVVAFFATQQGYHSSSDEFYNYPIEGNRSLTAKSDGENYFTTFPANVPSGTLKAFRPVTGFNTESELDPSSPSNLHASFANQSINLTWSAPQQFRDGRSFLGYNVYRDSLNINTEELLDTYFSDFGYEHGQTYSYFVTAIYDVGESLPSNSATVQVPSISVDFEASSTDIFIGDEIQFTNLTQNSSASYYWEFGDGSGSEEENPVYAYYEIGTFTVSLTMMDDFGSITKTKEDYITVNSSNHNPSINLPASFTFVKNSTLEVDFSQYISDLDEEDELILYTEGSQFIYAEVDDFVVTFEAIPDWFGSEVLYFMVDDQADFRTIRANVGKSRGIASDSVEVTVVSVTAGFMANKTEALSGETLQFTDLTVGNPNHWVWYLDNDNIPDSYLQNPSFTYNESGSYSISLVVSYFDDNEALVVTDSLRYEDYISVEGTPISAGVQSGTWEVALSPFNVFGEISIEVGDTLLIESGTVINFMEDSEFIVDGQLIANGVVFGTANPTGREVTQWQGIKFTPSATNSVLTNCTVQNGIEGVEITGASPSLIGLTIEGVDGEHPALLIQGGSQAIIDDLQIDKFNNGIEIRGDESGAIPTLTNIRVRHTTNTSRDILPEEVAVKIQDSNAEITGLEIDDFAKGIEIKSTSSESIPTLTNIRVRHTTNTSRTTDYGIRVEGNSSPLINDVEIVDFSKALIFDALNSEPIPTLTNIRVRHTTNTSRNPGEVGLEFIGSISAVIDSLEVDDYTTALSFENTTRTELSTPTLTNIRVRHTTNTSRTDAVALKSVGKVNLIVDNFESENVKDGISVYSDQSTIPTLTNIRVRHTTNTSRELVGTGLAFSGNTSPQLSTVIAENFLTGINFDNSNGTFDTIPTLTNIRVRHTTNTSRTDAVALKSLGKVNLQITDFESENVKDGISIYSSDESIPTLTNIRVRHTTNTSRELGGTGIELLGSVAVIMDSILVENCETGIYLENLNRTDVITPTLTNIRVRHTTNTSRTDAVALKSVGSLNLKVMNFESENVKDGINLFSSDESIPTLTNIRVRHTTNTSRNEGIGISLNGQANAWIKNSLIEGFNIGLQINGNNHAKVERNAIIDNQTAIKLIGAENTAKIHHNHIENTVTGFATCLELNDVGSQQILNNNILGFTIIASGYNSDVYFGQNIIWGQLISANNLSIGTSLNASFEYNNISYETGLAPGLGNLNIDPMFIASDDHNLILSITSPCIDAGNPNLPLDPDGSIADLGMNYIHHFVNFNSTSRFVILGTLIQFYEESEGHDDALTSVLWDFGDGSFSTERNPEHLYQGIGLYTTTLTMNTGSYIDVISRDVFVVIQMEVISAPQNPIITMTGSSLNLAWEEITDTANGNPISGLTYLVYSCDEPNGMFEFRANVEDLNWTDLEIAQHPNCQFYFILGYVGTGRASLEDFIQSHQFMSREGEVLQPKLKNESLNRKGNRK